MPSRTVTRRLQVISLARHSVSREEGEAVAGETHRRKFLRAALLAGLVLLAVGASAGSASPAAAPRAEMTAGSRPPANDDEAAAVAVSGDGTRVFVTGYSEGGWVDAHLKPGCEGWTRGLAIQTDGKIVAAGICSGDEG